MKLVLITGKKGSGKSTFLEIAKERGYNIEEVDWGYQKLILENNPKLATLPPPNEWEEHVMKLVFEEYWTKKYDQDAIIFFTGLYRPSEVNYLRSLAGVSLKIVSIVVDDDTVRYQRLLRRARGKEANYTIDDYKLKDLHRDGSPEAYKNNSISTIMSLADYEIKNNNLDKFKEDAKHLIDVLEKNYLKRVIA
ncbi:MAG: hypothetical protein QXS81_04680 [Candidatus Micrarchaeaceae archaeon]